MKYLKATLMKIKSKGFIKSHRADNTGIGKTIEDEMGIIENNIPGCDFIVDRDKVELKAQRQDTSSRITLSTKEPNWTKNKLRVIQRTGYRDKEGRWGLKITLNTLGFNKKNYKLELSKDKVSIIHKTEGEICFFKIKELIKLIKEKIGENLLLSLAVRRKQKDEEYFHYTAAIYFSGFNEESFLDLLSNGKIIWEFRLHLKPSGAIRDHGSGFRISRKFLKEIYSKEINLLS